MNFLAHLFLSGDDEKIMVGNFIADFVKGRAALSQFDQGIVKGIALHRSIDEFTDKHPIVISSKKRLREKYRHYAGVIVDVFYDHFLAINWKEFHPETLEDFSHKAYQVLQRHYKVLPDETKYMLPYMINGNWLLNYARIEGIHRALSGMAKRTPYTSKMDEAVVDLQRDYDDYQNEFKIFFPLLQEHCKDYPSV